MKLKVCVVALAALFLLSSCSIMEAEETRSVEDRIWDAYGEGYIDGEESGYDRGYENGYSDGRFDEQCEQRETEWDEFTPDWDWEHGTLYDYFHEPGSVTWAEAAEAID